MLKIDLGKVLAKFGQTLGLELAFDGDGTDGADLWFVKGAQV